MLDIKIINGSILIIRLGMYNIVNIKGIKKLTNNNLGVMYSVNKVKH